MEFQKVKKSCILPLFIFISRDDPINEESKNGGDNDGYVEDPGEVSSTDDEGLENYGSCTNCPSRTEYGENTICCMDISRWQLKFVSKGTFI